MRQVTRLMIKEYKIKELGYDFMGYTLQKGDIYTFHHLMVPNRNGGPYQKWNGAILCGKTSHPYLHVIEEKDYDMFCSITSEMIDMNMRGCLSEYNLRKIDDILCQFEREHCSDRTLTGKILIREPYTQRLFRR